MTVYRIGNRLNHLAGKFSADTRKKGKGTKTGTPHDSRSFYMSQYELLKGSHMTKVVWLPNETDYSYCEIVAPNTPYYEHNTQWTWRGREKIAGYPLLNNEARLWFLPVVGVPNHQWRVPPNQPEFQLLSQSFPYRDNQLAELRSPLIPWSRFNVRSFTMFALANRTFHYITIDFVYRARACRSTPHPFLLDTDTRGGARVWTYLLIFWGRLAQ